MYTNFANIYVQTPTLRVRIEFGWLAVWLAGHILLYQLNSLCIRFWGFFFTISPIYKLLNYTREPAIHIN